MSDATQSDVVLLIAVLVGAVAVFLAAVWFGLSVLGPRIGRALDRADTDDEESGDRPD